MKWTALFSRTGNEIYNISLAIQRNPDVIGTNRKKMDGVNKYLLDFHNIQQMSKKPSIEEYHQVLEGSDLVTLHGYLRILPDEICEQYNIYNLHPGLINKYPELKGFNPQEKAYNLKLPTSGSVIHKVIPEVDSGEIVDYIETDINNLNLDEIYQKLHDDSSKLWIKFLKEKVR